MWFSRRIQNEKLSSCHGERLHNWSKRIFCPRPNFKRSGDVVVGFNLSLHFPAFIYYSLRKPNNSYNGNGERASKKALIHMIFGGLVLLGGTMLLVRSALLITELCGLKEFYVGLTITALGCIIPETAVSLLAAFAENKKYR